MRSQNLLPNAYYDAIVFVTPGVMFMTGVAIGLGNLINWNQAQKFNWNAVNLVIAIIVIWLLGYEYGRIVSAWSSIFVQAPLRLIARKTAILNNPDFTTSLYESVKSLNLEGLEEVYTGSKWTIYYYAMLVNSTIGGDLLKRYAWEKLARSSALTFLILFTTSSTWKILSELFKNVPAPNTPFSFGTPLFTIINGFLMILTYYEYYQRNCWNNDLLRKVVPVLLLAGELKKSENKLLVTNPQLIDS